MKRIDNLYHEICAWENIQLADEKARKRKKNTWGVVLHDRERESNLKELQTSLTEMTYQTSRYTTFKVWEPKERDVYRLPYFPDRIAHHAIMNVLEPYFVASFTADTYSCIKGRGIHAAANNLKRALKDQPGTQYCLKMDIRKFYQSIDHDVLKRLLRRKFKDAQLLWLLDEIIDSADGVPIGNYLSQYLANFYLTYFDHWLKEVKGVKYYFRYADDIVILHSSKEYLHQLRRDISGYLHQNLKLELKPNYQVFPVAKRGIDFLGYVFFHSHTLLRKTIKQSFARMICRRPNRPSIEAYKGWAKHANTNHLIKKLLHEPNQKIQGFRNKSRKQRIRRRQDKNSPHIKPSGHCT